jgi:hypothetical protein
MFLSVVYVFPAMHGAGMRLVYAEACALHRLRSMHFNIHMCMCIRGACSTRHSTLPSLLNCNVCNRRLFLDDSQLIDPSKSNCTALFSSHGAGTTTACSLVETLFAGIHPMFSAMRGLQVFPKPHLFWKSPRQCPNPLDPCQGGADIAPARRVRWSLRRCR